MPCMCGACDCLSCGRAQGYRVAVDARGRAYNPENCARCGDEFHPEEIDNQDHCATCAEIVAEESEEV